MARYATNTDIDSYFKDFTVRYYGTRYDDNIGTMTVVGQTAIDRDFDRESKYIDSKLSVLGYKTPLGLVGTTYDPIITEWVCMCVIYKRLIYIHADDYQDQIPADIQIFKERADKIEEDLVEGGLSISVDTTMEETGIGYPYAGGTATTSVATFLNNKEYGGIYTNDYWEGRVIVQIDGTDSGNYIGKATFKWSKDGGHSYEDTLVDTSTYFKELCDGICVRWHPTGTSAIQVDVNDWWYFDIVPKTKKVKFYKNYITVKEFERG